MIIKNVMISARGVLSYEAVLSVIKSVPEDGVPILLLSEKKEEDCFIMGRAKNVHERGRAIFCDFHLTKDEESGVDDETTFKSLKALYATFGGDRFGNGQMKTCVKVGVVHIPPGNGHYMIGKYDNYE